MLSAQQEQPKPKVRIVGPPDQVKIDGVLKEQVRLEKQATSTYDEKWLFMQDFPKICVEEAKKMGFSEEEYIKMKTKKKPPKIYRMDVKDIPSSENFPTTSSGMIGWRSSRLECSLEVFGRLYMSPLRTLQPPGRPPTPPQRYIILG